MSLSAVSKSESDRFVALSSTKRNGVAVTARDVVGGAGADVASTKRADGAVVGLKLVGAIDGSGVIGMAVGRAVEGAVVGAKEGCPVDGILVGVSDVSVFVGENEVGCEEDTVGVIEGGTV